MTTPAPRFHCPITLSENTEIVLPEAAAHHAVRVLRLEAGDAVALFDGAGGEYAASIVAIGKTVTVAIGAHRAVERESPLDITLAQALASHDKMDWIVQKAVELGVTRIQPLLAARSVSRPRDERAAKRIAHWQAVAIGACEQCGRNRVPEVLQVGSFDDALTRYGAALKLALAPGDAGTLAALGAPRQPMVLFVGPEGGFSEAETAAMRSVQCEFVRLGPRVLRTETAGMAALAAIQALWGDLK
jgi:16S rRNA (uracil1498-N3)-methyltransferase